MARSAEMRSAKLLSKAQCFYGYESAAKCINLRCIWRTADGQTIFGKYSECVYSGTDRELGRIFRLSGGIGRNHSRPDDRQPSRFRICFATRGYAIGSGDQTNERAAHGRTRDYRERSDTIGQYREPQPVGSYRVGSVKPKAQVISLA